MSNNFFSFSIDEPNEANATMNDLTFTTFDDQSFSVETLPFYSNNILFQEDSSSPLSSPFLQSSPEDMSNVEASVEVLISSDQSSPDYSASSSDYEFLPQEVYCLPNNSQPAPLSFTEFSVSSDVLEAENTLIKEEKKEKKTRGRKRQRADECESKDISTVQLTRDQLLNFSSVDMDSWTEQLTASRKLTQAEEKEIKRQRRLIKNRESAQASRERKKNHVDDLEAEKNTLQQQNRKLAAELAQIKNQNASLQTENRTLKDELGAIKTWWANRKQPETDNDSNNSWLSFGNNLLSVGKRSSSLPSNSTKVKAASVTLLIVLFSFGLFFNTNSQGSSLPSRLRAVREEIPNVLPHAAASLSTSLFTARPQTTRRLQELTYDPKPVSQTIQFDQTGTDGLDNDADGEVPEEVSPKLAPTMYEDLRVAHRRDSSPILRANTQEIVYSGKEMSYNSSFTPIVEALKRRKALAVGKDGDEGENIGALFLNSNETHDKSLLQDTQLNRWFAANVEPRPNTAYLAVGEVQQIIPDKAQPYDPSAPFYLSLLVPSQHNNTETNSEENVMVEITCNVVEMKITHGYSPVRNDAILA